MSGKNFNGGCCFDYGNSETNDRDDGAGAMEAIYFGNAHWRGNSGGSGGDPEGGGPVQPLRLRLVQYQDYHMLRCSS